MTLFNALELWSTRCGEDETFGFDSILCTNLETSTNKIIVGSLNGLLRIYEIDIPEPRSFKASDLLLETQLLNPILQIGVGKLVSGSRVIHIAIAHPRSITVYNLTSIPGSTEHGNQYELKIIYEHPLQRSHFQLIVGPFGGVKGRDFICSYALDGTLTFFEQETFVHESQLPTFLLPTSMVYVPEADLFVTTSADWCLEAYRYQDLVNTSRKKIIPTWSYNLGESIIGVKSYRNRETFIVTLSEHNFACFSARGVIKWAKRLQYSAICFCIFFNDFTKDVMVSIVSDSGVLFVYENTTLRWSAKLPVVPVSILVAELGMKGILVLLSECGDLRCCYLGTKPMLFVAPPLENSITNYKNVGPKLSQLEEKINDMCSSAKSLTLDVVEQEIAVTAKILPYDKSLNYCQLVVDLIPSRPLSNVQITFNAPTPFSLKPKSYTLPSLCEKAILNTLIQVDDFKDVIPTGLEIVTIVSHTSAKAPCMIRKSTKISAQFVLSPGGVTDEKFSSRIFISTNKPPLPLTVLFQEFRGTKWTESGNNDEIASFSVTYNPEIKCAVSLCKAKYGYELASNSIPLMYLLLKYLLTRCKSHKTADSENSTFDCKNMIKNELKVAVEKHLSLRNEIRGLQSFLEKLSSQYRLIQRRFLIKLKENVSKPMSALQILYNDIYQKILETIRSIEAKQKELVVSKSELESAINLSLDLIAINGSIQSRNVEELRAALAATSLHADSQGWEERANANLIYLLKTTLSANSKDQLFVIPSSEKVVDDFSQFWKVLCTAFDYVSDGKFSISSKLDQTRKVTPIMEDEEEEHETKEKRFRYQKNEKLLFKRRSYVNANIIEHLNDIE